MRILKFWLKMIRSASKLDVQKFSPCFQGGGRGSARTSHQYLSSRRPPTHTLPTTSSFHIPVRIFDQPRLFSGESTSKDFVPEFVKDFHCLSKIDFCQTQLIKTCCSVSGLVTSKTTTAAWNWYISINHDAFRCQHRS